LIGYLDSENQNVQLEICIVYSETGPKEKIDLPIWGFLPNNFLRFVILQKIGTLPAFLRLA